MESRIREEIQAFVEESPANRFPDSNAPYFDTPLIGYAAAADPLFLEYQRVIGPFHRTPAEILSGAATVISWILPISRATRESNRPETQFPSRDWALTRHFGEQFNRELRCHLTQWLTERGYRAVAPQLSPEWQEFAETPVGIASTWSERHAAYAAGLGTFSLNDALITPKGIAHRCGSVITDLMIPATPRPYPDFRHNCLYYRNASCGLCIARCPVGAISHEGHDKKACSIHVYTTSIAAVGQEYGVASTGCGLCQTKVPCEAGIPRGKGA
jgi:epoxyqueuosine reductase QueG